MRRKIYYKLTDEEGMTYHGMQWGEGITHTAKGKGNSLCSEDVIHVYDHPLKAVMFNPIHANFSSPQLWECYIDKVVASDKLKIGVKTCTTVKRIALPRISVLQRIHFAVLCTLEVYNEPTFVQWAGDWLSDKNRTTRAAWATEAAAWAAEAATSLPSKRLVALLKQAIAAER